MKGAIPPPRHERCAGRQSPGWCGSTPQAPSVWAGSSSIHRCRQWRWRRRCTWRADCLSRPAITVCSRTARTAPRPPSGGPCSPSGPRRSRTRRCRGAPTIERITPTPTARVTPTRSPVGPGSPTSDGCSVDVRRSADVTLLTDLWAVRSIRLRHRYDAAVASGSDSSCQRSSPHSGATRGAGCSSPGSSVPPSSCRRRSA